MSTEQQVNERTQRQTGAAEPAFLLQVTEANHDEGEFFTLGGAGFLTEEERRENLGRIERLVHDCKDPAVQRCYFVDVIDPGDQFSIIDDVEISEQTAHELLGVEDFDPIRKRERALFRAVDVLAEATR